MKIISNNDCYIQGYDLDVNTSYGVLYHSEVFEYSLLTMLKSLHLINKQIKTEPIQTNHYYHTYFVYKL